jgi:hypothetical protein
LVHDSKAWHAKRLRYINNEWTTVKYFTIDSGGMLRYDPTEEEDDDTIQLWCITSPDSHISRCGFVSNTAITANNFRNNW